MPFTFFAHQAPVLPLKLARPRWFDGTALCIGSMAPDVAYPLGPWLARQSHTALGVVTWSLAFTVVASALVRRHVAPVAFAHLPDAGPFRVHSLRALHAGRPPLARTAASALIGAGVHVLLDGFTHTGRFGAKALGYDDVVVDLPFGRSLELARVFQDFGHVFGSLAGMLLMLHVGRRRLMERWYGDDTVRRARAFHVAASARLVFWCVVGIGLPAGVWWASVTTGVRAFRVIDAVAATTALACLLPVCRPIATPAIRR